MVGLDVGGVDWDPVYQACDIVFLGGAIAIIILIIYADHNNRMSWWVPLHHITVHGLSSPGGLLALSHTVIGLDVGDVIDLLHQACKIIILGGAMPCMNYPDHSDRISWRVLFIIPLHMDFLHPRTLSFGDDDDISRRWMWVG